MSHKGGMGDGMGDMPMPGNHNTGMHDHPMKKMMMHMTFFWGKDVEILFDGWPGGGLGMYILSLFVVFFLAILLEFLSNRGLVPSRVAGTLVHAVRVGLAYLVMLAVMSFNGGVLVAAVLGHAVGFAMFSRGPKPGSEPVGSATETMPGMKC
ncbi:copper transporter 6 [Amborella trichopoda]|nr:copper transporter 6 [Amborella trichopoda]|eukprot:XP_006850420.2 copper transporter 6 [Amborella trichopoda]